MCFILAATVRASLPTGLRGLVRIVGVFWLIFLSQLQGNLVLLVESRQNCDGLIKNHDTLRIVLECLPELSHFVVPRLKLFLHLVFSVGDFTLQRKDLRVECFDFVFHTFNGHVGLFNLVSQICHFVLVGILSTLASVTCSMS
eukprot:UN17397